jgi:hypothetical protein
LSYPNASGLKTYAGSYSETSFTIYSISLSVHVITFFYGVLSSCLDKGTSFSFLMISFTRISGSMLSYVSSIFQVFSLEFLNEDFFLCSSSFGEGDLLSLYLLFSRTGDFSICLFSSFLMVLSVRCRNCCVRYLISFSISSILLGSMFRLGGLLFAGVISYEFFFD